MRFWSAIAYDLEGLVENPAYRLNISETISISASAAAIFSADDGCGLPPNRKDMLMVMLRRSQGQETLEERLYS